MTCDHETVRERLVQLDMALESLGASLVGFMDLGFDPDAFFTPCDHVLQELVEDLGFEYREIREEAYRRNKEMEGGQ